MCCLLVGVCRLLFVDWCSPLFIVCCILSAVCVSLLCYVFFGVGCLMSSFVVCCLSYVVCYCLLFGVNCLLFVVYGLSLAVVC